ncbi:26084_t:CDS:2 [Gigaspora rosea]|nr:26084_t:CDS:2 [Gigaspora rosea]
MKKLPKKNPNPTPYTPPSPPTQVPSRSSSGSSYSDIVGLHYLYYSNAGSTWYLYILTFLVHFFISASVFGIYSPKFLVSIGWNDFDLR